jgi:DNA-binding PadR family transcriptional regulator
VTIRLPSEKEQLILRLLREHGELFGLDLVKNSKGKLGRGTVYVTLARMQEDKGLIQSRKTKPVAEWALPRPIYSLTEKGRAALKALDMLDELSRPRRGR